MKDVSKKVVISYSVSHPPLSSIFQKRFFVLDCEHGKPGVGATDRGAGGAAGTSAAVAVLLRRVPAAGREPGGSGTVRGCLPRAGRLPSGPPGRGGLARNVVSPTVGANRSGGRAPGKALSPVGARARGQSSAAQLQTRGTDPGDGDGRQFAARVRITGADGARDRRRDRTRRQNARRLATRKEASRRRRDGRPVRPGLRARAARRRNPPAQLSLSLSGQRASAAGVRDEPGADRRRGRWPGRTRRGTAARSETRDVLRRAQSTLGTAADVSEPRLQSR